MESVRGVCGGRVREGSVRVRKQARNNIDEFPDSKNGFSLAAS